MLTHLTHKCAVAGPAGGHGGVWAGGGAAGRGLQPRQEGEVRDGPGGGGGGEGGRVERVVCRAAGAAHKTENPGRVAARRLVVERHHSGPGETRVRHVA